MHYLIQLLTFLFFLFSLWGCFQFFFTDLHISLLFVSYFIWFRCLFGSQTKYIKHLVNCSLHITLHGLKHYENLPIQIYWKVNHRKIENFQTKNSNIFHISAQNIDCGYSLEPPRRGGSNEYPQSMFWAEIRKIKIMYTHLNPSFTI